MSAAGTRSTDAPRARVALQRPRPPRASLPRTRLGATGLEVARLGLGTVQLGRAYGLDAARVPSPCDAIACVHRALDRGIDFFDTAAAYGASEEILGRALRGLTSRPVVATKVSLPRRRDGMAERGDALRIAVESSALRSLERLGVEALDVLQVHNATAADLALPELEACMEALVRRGLVRHWGASTYGAADALAVLARPERFRLVQVVLNLLDRRLEAGVLPRARAAGTAVVLRSVFLKGVLSSRAALLPERLAPLERAAGRARACAAALRLTLPALALRFAAHHPLADVALAGTADGAEIDANADAAADGPLGARELEAVGALRVEDAALLDPSRWGL